MVRSINSDAFFEHVIQDVQKLSGRSAIAANVRFAALEDPTAAGRDREILVAQRERANALMQHLGQAMFYQRSRAPVVKSSLRADRSDPSLLRYPPLKSLLTLRPKLALKLKTPLPTLCRREVSLVVCLISPTSLLFCRGMRLPG
jgi:hypothetical protein